jgi:hypothetical protein
LNLLIDKLAQSITDVCHTPKGHAQIIDNDSHGATDTLGAKLRGRFSSDLRAAYLSGTWSLSGWRLGNYVHEISDFLYFAFLVDLEVLRFQISDMPAFLISNDNVDRHRVYNDPNPFL